MWVPADPRDDPRELRERSSTGPLRMHSQTRGLPHQADQKHNDVMFWGTFRQDPTCRRASGRHLVVSRACPRASEFSSSTPLAPPESAGCLELPDADRLHQSLPEPPVQKFVPPQASQSEDRP
jgi:hypothetical protein